MEHCWVKDTCTKCGLMRLEYAAVIVGQPHERMKTIKKFGYKMRSDSFWKEDMPNCKTKNEEIG